MTKLSSNISYIVRGVLFVIILIVLALFYFVGYNNPVGEYNAPEHTQTLMVLMYVLFGLTVASAVIAGVGQFIAALRDNPKGAIQSLLGLILLIVVFVVAYALGSDASVKTGDGWYEDKFWLKITDMLIYSAYFLLGVAVLATLVNLTGVLKK